MSNKKTEQHLKSMGFRRSLEINATINNFLKNIEATKKLYDIAAQEKKIKYDAYIKAGFTPDQTIELIK